MIRTRMLKMEANIKLLMDHMHKTECRYFTGDEEDCKRPSSYDDDEFGACHIACNCDGDIRKCDFPLEKLK